MCKRERMRAGLLKIGEVAKEARVQKTTVRYYTEIGLLKISTKMLPGGYRLYDRDETVDAIRRIKNIHEQNKTLGDIRQLLGTVPNTL